MQEGTGNPEIDLTQARWKNGHVGTKWHQSWSKHSWRPSLDTPCS